MSVSIYICFIHIKIIFYTHISVDIKPTVKHLEHFRASYFNFMTEPITTSWILITVQYILKSHVITQLLTSCSWSLPKINNSSMFN